MSIRDADPARDAPACAEIYAPYVLDGVASFEADAPDAAEMAGRIERVQRTHHWLLAEVDGVVAGYAYASPHRERAAYRWASEVTVYIGAPHQRRGLGRALYGALFERLRRQGMYVACAGITLPNPGSVRLHEAMGFERVGVYRGIGWKAGSWWDVGWWQLELRGRAAGDGQPQEPLPPSAALE